MDSFRTKVKGVLPFLHPVDHGRQDLFLKLLLVAYEIIIHKKDAAPPAKRIESSLIRPGPGLRF